MHSSDRSYIDERVRHLADALKRFADEWERVSDTPMSLKYLQAQINRAWMKSTEIKSALDQLADAEKLAQANQPDFADKFWPN